MVKKRQVNKSQKIEDKTSRGVTFCKRKRGLIKKAIELSRLCDQRIFIVIYDNEKDKAIQFSSDKEFSFREAFQSVNKIRKSTSHAQNLEQFCNADYDKFANSDFRSLRYVQKSNKIMDDDLFEADNLLPATLKETATAALDELADSVS